jgi:alkanesulfonate monooxygenase SsuD/methylene tetrahydromethanopterin reductase-like flavin-dependent oxidoreductase (luciferase family)
MSAHHPRTLRTVTGAGGRPDVYELALDPKRSTLDTAIRVAGLAEAAGFDALFVPDLLRFGAQGTIGAQEPLLYVAALSQATRDIGLIATVSTTFHHPFNLARMFGTLDHISNGRAACSRYVRQGLTLRELIVAAQDTGHWSVAGTPYQLANAIEQRFRAGVLDVIMLNGLDDPRQHDLIVNGLLPELRGRGIVAPAGYRDGTLREALGLDLAP